MTSQLTFPRIAFVVGTLTMGGSTTYLFNLAKGLVDRNIPCLVICDDDDHPLSDDFSNANIPVVTLGRSGSIYEDRMAAVVRYLRDFQATVQVGVLGHFSFDSLRYAYPMIFGLLGPGKRHGVSSGLWSCSCFVRPLLFRSALLFRSFSGPTK